MRLRYAGLAFVLCGALTLPASAGRREAALAVTASVAANCSVQSPIALDLGTYGPRNFKGKALVGKAKVLSIACTRGADGVRIALNNGKHFSDSDRHLIGPKHEKVAYQIYTSARLKEIWDETNTVSYLPQTSRATEIVLYGKVPGGQTPPPGQYSDLLTATVDF